jgi:hypothetical protein
MDSSKRKNLPHCNGLIANPKAPKNDQNMHHKTIHNPKDT